jgi:2-polyprenyl-3-methyl-5-hydroxy-6-metoxy-1,4-benzoquinol methylase
MNSLLNDPMGQAILDFATTKKNQDITVVSDICDDDIIPSAYLFRSFEEMPSLEKIALANCKGKILDVGAGAGIHAKFLKEKGFDVSCIDTSPRAIQHAKSIGLDARQQNFFDLSEGEYDTLLFLMNGIGISRNLANLEQTLIHAKSLLSENGRIICDSSDIKSLFEDDEGGTWIDLTSAYYGNFKFQMKYGEHTSDWFEWLYVDFENLKSAAEKAGYEAHLLAQDNDDYLAELRLK